MAEPVLRGGSLERSGPREVPTAQVRVELKDRLRSARTLVALVLFLVACSIWIPDPASGSTCRAP